MRPGARDQGAVALEWRAVTALARLLAQDARPFFAPANDELLDYSRSAATMNCRTTADLQRGIGLERVKGIEPSS